MPAPKQRKQASVDRILSAATQVFAEAGFDGARIDAIAARADVNKAMIYYHVGDKKALYHRVLYDVFRDTADRLTEAVARERAPVKKLKAYIRGMAATFDRHPLLPPIMMREFASGGRHLPEAMADTMLRILDTVAAIVKQGRKKKVFVSVHPLVLHLMVVGTMTYLRSTRPVRRRLSGMTGQNTFLRDSENDAADLADIEMLVLRAIRR